MLACSKLFSFLSCFWADFWVWDTPWVWSLTLEELQGGRSWALGGNQFSFWVHHMQLDLYLLLGGLLFGLYIV